MTGLTDTLDGDRLVAATVLADPVGDGDDPSWFPTGTGGCSVAFLATPYSQVVAKNGPGGAILVTPRSSFH